ncbi:MAG: hypothetical protein MR450_03970 [Prevotella sp.]|nr:hypothetical protein [Prevotella sp.]MDY4040460.1 hypothetical protein [Prevotella sp.]
MRWLPVSFILSLLLTLVACSREIDPGDIAAQAAKQYYEYLLEGKYDLFVDGMNQPDTIPGSYREQLITNAKMFVGQQKEEHRGIREVRVVSAEADTARRVANVFIVFAYGDSTSEEVLVPMVLRKGVWYMR